MRRCVGQYAVYKEVTHLDGEMTEDCHSLLTEGL